MEFDRFTIVLLLTNPDAPAVDDETAGALFDGHLAHLAELHEAGHLLAAGPLRDPAGELRGLSILNVDPERALELKASDPAVRAGVFLLRAVEWQVPAGAVHFTPTRFPHSVAEATGTE